MPDNPRRSLDDLVRQAPPAKRLSELDAHAQEDIRDRRADRDLRRDYAAKFIWFLAAQLIVMNAIMVFYGLGYLKFSDYLMHVYMTGTLAEIFGLVLVITRNLFPKK